MVQLEGSKMLHSLDSFPPAFIDDLTEIANEFKEEIPEEIELILCTSRHGNTGLIGCVASEEAKGATDVYAYAETTFQKAIYVSLKEIVEKLPEADTLRIFFDYDVARQALADNKPPKSHVAEWGACMKALTKFGNVEYGRIPAPKKAQKNQADELIKEYKKTH